MEPLGVGAMTTRGLAYWSAAVEGQRDVDPEAVAAMAGHPRFAEACWMIIALSLARYGRNAGNTRFARDFSALVYAYLVVYLDARGGITSTAIIDLCREAGVASAGRARAILFLLKRTGYIRADPANGDRRTRRYVASPELRAAVCGIITDQLRAFALIEPDAGHAADRLVEDDFCRAFLLRFGESLIASVKARPVRPISLFTQCNAGTLILFGILASAKARDVYPPREALRMSATELAQKHEVSRSHVSRLLREAERRGYLKRNADDQTGTIEEIFARELIEFQTIIFTGLAHCCQYAFRATAMEQVAAG